VINFYRFCFENSEIKTVRWDGLSPLRDIPCTKRRRPFLLCGTSEKINLGSWNSVWITDFDQEKNSQQQRPCVHKIVQVQYYVLRKGNTMDAMSYSAFRTNLAKTLDKVNDDHTPVLITRQNGKPAVLISLEDFHAYEETAYLMASPKNAQRLNDAIAEIEAGRFIPHNLDDE
jgi:antitoxin YefM